MSRAILRSGSATAAIALRGAEPVSWQVAGRELLWHGDPAHWSGQAPFLFPVVGLSAGGHVRVDGRAYPMPSHGFARDMDFDVVDRREDRVHLRLTERPGTLAHYPFAFRLDVTAILSAKTLTLDCEVGNPGDGTLPYALGFHPAFPWPLQGGGAAGADRSGHAVVFEKAEEPAVPTIAATGMLDPTLRPVPLDGPRLPLSPDLFASGALVFLNARSREMRFTGPSGEAIGIEAENFPHLALWTRPTAPFLSMEAWTGHGDWEGFTGELRERNTIRLLGAGDSARHTVTLRWHGV